MEFATEFGSFPGDEFQGCHGGIIKGLMGIGSGFDQIRKGHLSYTTDEA